MAAANFDYVVSSTGTVKFAVSVKAMANGAAVQPAFELWLDDGDNTNHASAPAEVVTLSVTKPAKMGRPRQSTTPPQASGHSAQCFALCVLIRWLQSALIPFVTTQASGY